MDLFIGVVEEGLQLIAGERALGGIGLALLLVNGGVPFVQTWVGCVPNRRWHSSAQP
ncbi:hypothetical protein AB0L06_40600 [Spirillospora sp. NPDC052269]